MQTLFNDNWQFTIIHLESAESPVPDLAELIKDESRQYAPVEIPHDWMIWNTNDLYENSIGIYKKTLTISDGDELMQPTPQNSQDLPRESAGLRRYLRFEGVYMDSTVFVNGEKAFVWKYGYTTFEVDITDFLKEGDNVIHVVAVYRSPNTRWYSGAGIYRNVWIKTVPQTHLAADGVYVSNRKVAQSADEWESFYQVEVVSHIAQKSVAVKTTLLSADGAEIASETKPLVLTSPGSVMESSTSASEPTQSFAVCSGEFHLQDIRVWDIADPYLYTLKTELFAGNCESCANSELLDNCTQKIGFRTIEYNADKGFFLNGRHVKIHGACLHHDLGCLGSAFNKSALKRQF